MLRIHSLIEESRANGPGRRLVVWFQGCTLACPGCANPLTHPKDGGFERIAENYAFTLYRKGMDRKLDGVTLTGGEPFQQDTYDLYFFLKTLHDCWARMTVVVFTGYTMEELAGRNNYWLNNIFRDKLVDVLISGRYDRTKRANDTSLISSSNQKLVFVTDRPSPADFAGVAEAEYHLDFEAGTQTKTGVR